MMNDIREVSRRPAPFARPQSIALDGSSMWIGSIETEKIYQLDPDSLAVRAQSDAPGKPWGMTFVNGELRVICGETDEDNRVIRRFVPGSGFRTGDAIRCPDDTGSQLGFDGHRLFVSQWYNRRLLGLDDDGTVRETIEVPHQICGQTIVDGAFYLMTTEDETTNDYWLTRVTRRDSDFEVVDLARVPFHARALAFDGRRFWTNHREAHEIVSFELP